MTWSDDVCRRGIREVFGDMRSNASNAEVAGADAALNWSLDGIDGRLTQALTINCRL